MAYKINEKQFLIVLVAWFVFAYLLLWFFGGSCASIFGFPGNVPVDSVCMSSNALSGLRNVPVIGLVLPYNPWVSVMYFFAPIAGFVLAFFLIKWFNEYFDTRLAVSIWFLLLMIFVLLFGYYINLSWYYQEFATLNSNSQVRVSMNPFLCFFEPSSQSCSDSVNKVNNEYYAQYQAGSSQILNQYIKVDYWAELRESIYLLFILGALAAWLPLFGRELVEKHGGKEDHKHAHHDHKEHHEHAEHHKEKEHHERRETRPEPTPEQRDFSEMTEEVFETEKEFEKRD